MNYTVILQGGALRSGNIHINRVTITITALSHEQDSGHATLMDKLSPYCSMGSNLLPVTPRQIPLQRWKERMLLAAQRSIKVMVWRRWCWTGMYKVKNHTTPGYSPTGLIGSTLAFGATLLHQVIAEGLIVTRSSFRIEQITAKEVYRQLNNQEHYRQLPADPTKEHTRELNTLIRTLDPVLQSSLRSLIPRISCVGDFYCLPKVHNANTPGRPIVSGNGTLCENLSGCVEGIFKPIVQGIPSFCRDTTDFLQKLSTHGPVEPGTFLVTMDVSALYTSIPHNDGIAATASVLNTNNCQSPNTILQLIHFILDHNVFTFDNQFFIQTHGTAMGTKFAPQYVNIFMHRFKQEFFSMQDLQPTLYTRYIDDISFLWTHGWSPPLPPDEGASP
ncbi:uncharacterized protein [Chiloscyllium punctatum]|uniref:uncharacterized protein n=1 Tax=Chiloscyllium punctatum TaxID=137246 RepID=UPI003B63CFEB